MEGQGQAAEQQAGHQGQPLAFFQFALFEKQDAVNHQRAGNQHRRSAVDTPYREAVPADFDDAWLDFVDDEKQ